MQLNSLLIDTCVRIGNPNLFGFGTGFFIDEFHILTCYHCIENMNWSSIAVYKNGEYFEAEYIVSEKSSLYDVALLAVKRKSQYAVWLSDEIETNDSVSFFGFSLDNFEGESVSLVCEGLSFNESKIQLIKLKDGKIAKGHSGSPLLNVETSSVVGMICETANSSYPMGGYAIPITSIKEVYPNAIGYNLNYNIINTKWKQLCKASKMGIGIYDKTLYDDHFLLNNTIEIDEFFIEPNYKLVTIKNLEDYVEIETCNDVIKDSLNILDRYKMLLILGQFGTGKTLLSKIIQHRLMKNGFKTAFIKCSDVSHFEAYDTFYINISSLKPKNKPLYLIFDGYDELNLLSNDKTSIIGKFLENVITLSKEKDYYIIVNSRNIHKKENEVYQNISLQFDELRKETLVYLVVEQFTHVQLSNFMDSFANAMGKRKHEKRLFVSDLKNFHKHLKNACLNPLFIFWFEMAYYDNQLNDSADLYDVYDSFVKKTIQGKFSFESQNSSAAINEIKDKYKYFVRRLAADILINNRRKVKVTSSELHEFYLDDNSLLYSLDHKSVSKDIEALSKEIIAVELMQNLSKIRLRENVLTCYFLDCFNGAWRFKDNNLLFFLVAETYYDKIILTLNYFKQIIGISETSSNDLAYNNVGELYKSFKDESIIPLHPLSIEFLFQKIDKFKQEDKEYLWSFIYRLIEEKEVLQINESNLQRLDISKINIDLLLLLIFKKINKQGFDENHLMYFFKRYNWFISAAKIIDRSYLHLAQRFFKSSFLSRVELRRINFTGYNFDYSNFNDVSFIQNKMYDVRLNHCIFNKVKFILCDFKNVEIDSMSGNLLFFNCIIDKVYIKSPNCKINTANISFKNCQIKWIEFSCKGRHREYESDIELTGCDIGNFKAENMVFNKFILNKCIKSNLIINMDLIREMEDKENAKR